MSIYAQAGAILRSMVVDLNPVLDAIAAIDIPSVDLSGLTDAVNDVAQTVSGQNLDLTPLLDAINGLDFDTQVDLVPVQTALSGLSDQINGLNFDVDLSPIIEAVNGQNLDLTPLLDAVNGLDFDTQVDLAPVQTALSGLSDKINGLNLEVDLNPIIEAVNSASVDLSPVLDAVSSVGTDVSQHKADWDQFVQAVVTP